MFAYLQFHSNLSFLNKKRFYVMFAFANCNGAQTLNINHHPFTYLATTFSFTGDFSILLVLCRCCAGVCVRVRFRARFLAVFESIAAGLCGGKETGIDLVEQERSDANANPKKTQQARRLGCKEKRKTSSK